MAELVFDGLKVIDCASFIAGPAAATVMSDFGAEVIKIEPLGAGDAYRRRAQPPVGPGLDGIMYDEPDDRPHGEMPPDEPSPDDRAVRDAELTGMDLIQRELGGRVIGEFEG